jgi:hypothetical protein
MFACLLPFGKGVFVIYSAIKIDKNDERDINVIVRFIVTVFIVFLKY